MENSRTRQRVVGLIVIAIMVGGGLLYLRVRGLSARAKPTVIEEWVARRVRSLATPTSVKQRVNPVQVTELVMAEARDHFADHCAICHGNRGEGKTMLGEGMFPPPPDLRQSPTQALTDGEIFNIIQNGIRFTGMPGFGGSDEDNWKLTLFVRHLPRLSEREEQLMVEMNHLSEEAHE